MKLTIIGASGHGRVVADIAEKNGYDDIEFMDDNEGIVACGKWPVVGAVIKAKDITNDLFIAIGNVTVREELMNRFRGHRFPTLIHPSTVIADDVEIGEGSVVMAGAVVNPGAKIGRGVIINTCASVDHDCIIGDFAHVSVGAHLCGTVTIGKGSWIAVGVCVGNNVNICGGCTIGAGAVVIKDIKESGTYVGVPARNISHS